MGWFDAPAGSSYFGNGDEGPLSRLLRMTLSGGDSEAEGHARASSAMEPVTGPYLHDVATGQMAARNMPQNFYDPNRSFAQNTMDPQALEQAQNVAMSFAPQMIRAYHGSPHSFDKFDSSKIGEGEGAQAYGHGLYFAESEGVARDYRKRLAGDTYKQLDPLTIKDRSPEADYARQTLADYGRDPAAALAALESATGTAPVAWGYKAQSDPMRTEAARLIRGSLDHAKEVTPGHMYEVNINADPKDFLDWDKPLSEQPQKIQDIFRGALPDDAKGADIIKSGITSRDKAQISRGLNEQGIPGVKYLDQGSRGGDGTSNYAVFNDKIIEILRKYGLAGLTGGAGAAAGPYNQE